MLALGNYTRRDSFNGLGAYYMEGWPSVLECPRDWEPSLAFGAPRCIDPQGNETNPVRRSATVLPEITVAPWIPNRAGTVAPPATISKPPGISKPVMLAAIVGVGLLGMVAFFMK